jgi:hypothetical protein
MPLLAATCSMTLPGSPTCPRTRIPSFRRISHSQAIRPTYSRHAASPCVECMVHMWDAWNGTRHTQSLLALQAAPSAPPVDRGCRCCQATTDGCTMRTATGGVLIHTYTRTEGGTQCGMRSPIHATVPRAEWKHTSREQPAHVPGRGTAAGRHARNCAQAC